MLGAVSRRARFVLFVAILLGVLVGLAYRFGDRWLRRLLVFLSQSELARNTISELRIPRQVARRFVAGETVEEAMTAVRVLNAKGMMATIDYLGESVTDEELAVHSCAAILDVLDRIAESGVDANVSVKLTQLGLDIRGALALDNMRQILSRARSTQNSVRIDMEESSLVDATLDIYRRLRDGDGFDNVGVVIQAYLYRSEEDLRRLVEEGAWVRLCKGAYAEPPSVAYPRKVDTDYNYVRLTKLLLSERARRNGVYPALATHDENMIQAAIDYANAHDVGPHEFEFQMLYGIRRELQESLVRRGYRVRIYVPFGSAWYRYFVRRLAERPANLWFFMSSLVRD